MIRGIRHLLYDKGLTIKGVKKIIREQNVAHVRALADGTQPEMAEKLDTEQRKTLQAARQNLKQARILLVGEDG